MANVEPASGERVWGVLYSITDAQFDFLDRTEGVTQGFYRRVQVGIVGADGRVCEAATYVSDRGVAGRKASMRYLGLVLDGAREHGLPKSYVRALEGFEVAVDEREGETSPSD